eukprot:5357366-Amphidinium_carterae.1
MAAVSEFHSGSHSHFATFDTLASYTEIQGLTTFITGAHASTHVACSDFAYKGICEGPTLPWLQ